MEWQEFLEQYREQLMRETRYEYLFADTVLQHVKGLIPELVTPQKRHEERGGRERRIDFAIQEGEFVRLAIEIDGFDKTRSGRGWTYDQFDDFQVRQTDLITAGWRVLRFTNRRVQNEPIACRESIELNLADARALAPRVGRAELSPAAAKRVAPGASLGAKQSKKLKELTKAEDATLRAEFDALKEEAAKARADSARLLAESTLLKAESAKVKAQLHTEVQQGKRRRTRIVVAALIGVAAVGVGAFALASQPHELGVAPASAQTCPADHPIKGNISTAGKIFHVPGGDFYAATKPERCFKDPAEADSAGYRRSKR